MEWKGLSPRKRASSYKVSEQGGLCWRYGMIEPCRLWMYSSLVGIMSFVGEGEREDHHHHHHHHSGHTE